jgi:hypothetical protein
VSDETPETPIERLRRRFDEGHDPTDDELWAAMRRDALVIAAVGRDRRTRHGRSVMSHGANARLDDPRGLARLSRHLPGGANRGGRTKEVGDRLADYRTAILALAAEGYTPAQITARRVLGRVHRTGSDAQLWKDVGDPDVGGWRAFRADVLGSQLGE